LMAYRRKVVGLLLRRIEAEEFLSFGQRIAFDVDPGLTVVTGPNGAGKSNLGRCLELGRAVIGQAGNDPARDRLELYAAAGYQGASSFTVALGLDLDQPWEQDLVRAFVCAAFAGGSSPNGSPQAPSENERDALARACLVRDSLSPLLSGSLVVCFDSARQLPWFAAWEFADEGRFYHVLLASSLGGYQLRAGRADPAGEVTGAGHMGDWLLQHGKAEDAPQIDFRRALQQLEQPVTFYVPSLTASSGSIPESLRELATALSVPDFHNRQFTFDQVLSFVLQRSVVLTDNRRLPLVRRFTQEALGGPVDLRDGARVGAELHRLKNGDVHQQERFDRIRATFRDLTRRTLSLRSRPAPPDQAGAATLVEPTVIDGRGERPIEFSGAGVQEALVLSVLLQAGPGQVSVLDEPAVNLEATTQRRLVGRLRGPGQYIVITHSADLVPVEQPEDLLRIVRVVPSPSGSVVLRPDLGDLDSRESLRWLQLLEPAHVRGLLFAAAVILCEGETEVAALPRWWRDTTALGLRDPEAANVPVIGVGGDSGFGAYVKYLDAFGVPWAIVADGPALRRHSKLAKQLETLGHTPESPPADDDDFQAWRDFWRQAGVFTLADKFGDDGTKGGEFEAFLRRVNPDLLDRARVEVGRNKPLTGAYFAAEHPEPPQDVLELYRLIGDRLGPAVRLDDAR
jgi:hypothetical protein